MSDSDHEDNAIKLYRTDDDIQNEEIEKKKVDTTHRSARSGHQREGKRTTKRSSKFSISGIGFLCLYYYLYWQLYHNILDEEWENEHWKNCMYMPQWNPISYKWDYRIFCSIDSNKSTT